MNWELSNQILKPKNFVALAKLGQFRKTIHQLEQNSQANFGSTVYFFQELFLKKIIRCSSSCIGFNDWCQEISVGSIFLQTAHL
jgi:hypothetical protein